ncbi:MAG: hypothetical protein HY329_27210 [Chloroflexi bacterium]|nr:hypothetical protein [Chloroflexota bacterium]
MKARGITTSCCAKADSVRLSSRTLGVLSIGAGLMYLLDPHLGRRRRALILDRGRHVGRALCHQAVRRTGDAIHQARGLFAETRALFTGGRIDDRVLRDRLRSSLGRIVRHPHSIVITVTEGHVHLSGPILADEVTRLVAAVSSAQGVKSLETSLDTHVRPDHIPGLQGEPSRRRERAIQHQCHVAGLRRVLAAFPAGALVGYGVARADRSGALALAAGIALLGLRLTGRDADTPPQGGRDLKASEFEEAEAIHWSALIDEASEESFPASDPPAFTATTVG